MPKLIPIWSSVISRRTNRETYIQMAEMESVGLVFLKSNFIPLWKSLLCKKFMMIFFTVRKPDSLYFLHHLKYYLSKMFFLMKMLFLRHPFLKRLPSFALRSESRSPSHPRPFPGPGGRRDAPVTIVHALPQDHVARLVGGRQRLGLFAAIAGCDYSKAGPPHTYSPLGICHPHAAATKVFGVPDGLAVICS